LVQFDYRSRKQFATEGQPFVPAPLPIFNGGMYSTTAKGHDYPITARWSRNLSIPAPPPPRKDYLKSLTVKEINNGFAVLVTFEPADGEGDAWFSIYNNGVFRQSVFVREGDTTVVSIPADNGLNIVTVVSTGQEQFKYQDNILGPINEIGQKVQLDWTWDYEIIGNPDSELSNWTLDGLKIENTLNGSPVTRRKIEITIVASGGTVTVSSSTFSGSGPVGNTITLTALNQSGVTGSVEASASAVTASEVLAVRLPQSIGVFRDVTPSPAVKVADVAYNNRDAASWKEPADLDGGPYYYRLQATSDTGEVGLFGADVTIVVPDRPGPPADLAYSSGGAANTVLSFTPSDTVGATYNLYMRNIGDGNFNTDNPVATAIAWSSTIAAPAVIGYPGTVSFILRAELNGIEELNNEILDIEYDGVGVRVDPRPNDILINGVDVSTGTTLDVDLTYNSADEAGVATQGQLFVRTPTGVYDFNAPDDASSLIGTNIRNVSLTVTLATGWYYITAMAATASGVQSVTPTPERLVYISDDDIASPTPTAKIIG